jgi:hypothetical protein
MRSSHQIKFDISFIDFLFQLLLAFVVIAIIAVIHMNPPTKKSDAPKKAEFIITVEWTKKSDNDVDVWLLSGHEKKSIPLHFRKKQMAPFFLDRDDTGRTIDSYKNADGSIQVVDINREVITARGWPKDGEYFVNLHMYNKRVPTVEDVVTLSIIQLNPYRLIYERNVKLDKAWEEKDIVSFRILDKEIIEVQDDHKVFYVKRFLDDGPTTPRATL